MTTGVVIDSSALVALLADSGEARNWVHRAVAGREIAAPALAMFETANVLRRLSQSGTLTGTRATACHGDLLALPLELWPYRALADRAWELRANLSSYDAAYVALAEMLEASLVTLDQRLARAPGVLCDVRTFPG